MSGFLCVLTDENFRSFENRYHPAILAFLLPLLASPYPRRRATATGALNVVCLVTLCWTLWLGLRFSMPVAKFPITYEIVQ